MIKPSAIPFAIEYVNGMKTIVQNAGSAFVMSLKSMSFTPPSIKIPTKIKAGAVACAGIIEIIGTNIIDSKNKSAVVRLVSPVLPPSAIPADDSTTVVLYLFQPKLLLQ